MHTTYSDGSYSIPQIAQAAREAGLDVVLVTDHMSLQGLAEEGWYGDTLLLVGYEINDPDRKNHYLAFGLEEVLPPELYATQYLRRVRQEGGFGFVSHPDETRTAHPDYPAYPWTDWDVKGFDGIEIWNYMSEWMESVNRWNVGLKVIFPDHSTKGPTAKTLRWWDSSNRTAKVVGIGGVDAHAMKKRRGPFRFVLFPYERMFKTLLTHITLAEPLSGDLQRDKELVYGALRTGASFLCNHLLGDGRGFRFFAETGNAVFGMGESLSLSQPTRVVAVSPGKGVMRLLRDGEPILRRGAASLEYDVAGPGFYRVEVRRGRRFWILSNPIYVK